MQMKRCGVKALMTVVITSTGVLFGSSGLSCAEALQEYDLGQVVVTASRVQTHKVDTPANISVITNEKIADSNYANAAEALESVPGVNILGSGAKGSSMGQDKILLNGDARVLVLIDGRRVNVASSGDYSADWLPAIDNIERIEVLKGAGSALYGTDAVGGVINVITKKAEEGNTSFKARMGFGSFGSQQYSIFGAGRQNGLGVAFGLSKEKRNDFKYKNNLSGQTEKLDNSNYDTSNASFKIDKELKNNQRITMAFEHMLTEGGSPFGYYGYGTTDSHQRLQNNIALRYDWNENKDNSGFIQVYRNYHHALFHSPYESNQSDFNEKKLGAEIQQNWKLSSTNSLTAGFDYYDSEVENEAMYGGSNSVNNKALYLEDRWEFSPSWQLNSGLRYDKHSKAGSKLTPHFAVNKKFNDTSHAYVSWGKIFNAPTTDDLFWYQPGYGMYGNPDLKPETGDVWTIGYDTQLGQKTNLGINFFQSNITDAISWQYDAGFNYMPVNVDKEKRRGMELTAEYRFNDNWSANASYTYLNVKHTYSGVGELTDGSAVPNLYRAGVKYKNDRLIINLTARAGSGLAQNYLNSYGSYTKAYADSSYFTWDLGAKYKVAKNTSIYAQFNNINNAHYQDCSGLYSNGLIRYPVASRNYMLGLEYKF